MNPSFPIVTLSVVAQMVCTGPIAAQGTSNETSAPLTDAGARTVLSSLDGSWAGVLEYANYGTGERVEIPVALEQEATAIEPTLVRRVTFTDPGRVIESSEVARLDAAARTLVTIPLTPEPGQTGAGVERWTIESAAVLDRDDWTLVLTRAAADDNRPATLRRTQRMQGGELTSRTEVDYTDDQDDAWLFRNEIRVERADPDADDLLGRWTVDLRPTPDADPYTITMNLTGFDDASGDLQGTFYSGSPIENGRVNTSWWGIGFAFTTSDNSGVYFTSGMLRGGVLRGTTFSPGRGFMAVWEGTPKD